MACGNCGTLLPSEARFCLTCGAPQTPRSSRDEDPAPSPMPAYEPGVCEIELWRGYVKSEFVAVVNDGDEAYELARSPAFRFRGSDLPPEEDERVQAAFAVLVDRVAAEGWEPVGGGRPWFAYRFRRPVRDVHALPLPVSARDYLGEQQESEATSEPTG